MRDAANRGPIGLSVFFVRCAATFRINGSALLRETTSMNGPDMPRKQTFGIGRGFVVGQRVRVIAGPLRDFQGNVISCAEDDRVVVDAADQMPGLSIRISAGLLEAIDC